MGWIKRTPKPVPLETRGYAVVNGVRLHICGVVLRENQMHFVLRADGPCVLEGPITVFGVDDLGVFQGAWVEHREIRAHESFQINASLRVNSMDDSNSKFIWREERPPSWDR